MSDDNSSANRIDRRSVLKEVAVAAAGAGALLGGGATSAGATTSLEANNPDASAVIVHTESDCDSPGSALTPNGTCGIYLARCYHDGDEYLWMDWYDPSWPDGWVLRDHIGYC